MKIFLSQFMLFTALIMPSAFAAPNAYSDLNESVSYNIQKQEQHTINVVIYNGIEFLSSSPEEIKNLQEQQSRIERASAVCRYMGYGPATASTVNISVGPRTLWELHEGILTSSVYTPLLEEIMRYNIAYFASVTCEL